jgi:hypothetical protein
VKLLTTAGDSESRDGRPKENCDIISALQGYRNDRSHSPYIIPALLATAPQESVAVTGSQSAALSTNALMISELNDPRMPQQMAEVTDGKQEWEICDIIGKEVVDGEVHYLVEWSATLMPKCELEKAKGLVDKFEARLRAQERQRGGKGRGSLPQSKAGQQAAVGAHATQQKYRGRPRKQL